MEHPYKHISVLIMPTDYCNMNCVYCFNGRKTCTEKKCMTMDTVRHIFEITIPYYEEVSFIWHGGEPTSMGLAFYQEAMAIQEEINTKNISIRNSIQSNMTLMDAELAEFLQSKNFHFGSSFDGTRNERTRHNSENILAGRQTVLKAGGKVGFICVVQRENIDCLIEDYEWFKEQNINYTLNMYMTVPPYEEDPLYISPEEYATKFCELYDYWLKDKDCKIHISNFDDYAEFILFGEKHLCSYNSCMGKHVGVQYDGRLYSCNRDFPEEYSFGNIWDYSDIRECFSSEGFENLMRKAIARRNICKDKCEIYEFCSGGCNSCAVMGGDAGQPNDYVCISLRMIYAHIKMRIDAWRERPVEEIEELNPYFAKKVLYALSK